MNKKRLQDSFQRLTPSQETKERIFNTILESQADSRKKNPHIKQIVWLVSSAAALCMVIGCFFAMYSMNVVPKSLESEVSTVDNAIGSTDTLPSISEDAHSAVSQGEITVGSDIMRPWGVFYFEGKRYEAITEDIDETNFQIKFAEPSQVGEKIGTIEDEGMIIDPSFIGRDVYEYLPSGCEAVIVVKCEGENWLFQFTSFASYNENQDEAASAYLDIYGIQSAEDIEKIQFYSYPDATSEKLENTITDRSTIEQFYAFYKPLQNTSDRYFEVLDEPVEVGETALSRDISEANTAPYEGTSGDKLENSRTIRIFTKTGLSYDIPYYPNIGFLSRYELDSAFREFLNQIGNIE